MEVDDVLRESLADRGRRLQPEKRRLGGQLEQAIAMQEKLMPIAAIARCR
jgi:hypothetical protein